MAASIPVYDVRLVQARRPLRLAERTLRNPGDAQRVLQQLIGATDREHFVAVFLNANHDVVGCQVVAVGGQSRIGIDRRTVFRAAIAACAATVVFGHNHPSGDPKPSIEDEILTRNLVEAGELLDIPVMDHIIVTRDPSRSCSMFEAGLMPRKAGRS